MAHHAVEKQSRVSLLAAIRLHDSQKVEELVEGGAPLNRYIKFKDGMWIRYYTPLCLAISCGTMPIVQYLLHNGARVDKAGFCETADYQEKFTPLFLACRDGKLSIVQMLISAGADVNQPLTGAKILEEEGGFINYADIKNRCIHWATMYRKLSLLQTLVDCGADPLVQNCHGETPLHLACDTYDPDIIRLLIKSGGVASHKDMYGTTPLTSLLTHNGDTTEQISMTRLILAAGYDISHEPWFIEFKNQNGNHSRNPDNQQTHMDVIIDKFGVSFLKWLHQWSSVPHSLTYLCRGAVRRNIGGVILRPKLRQLPLPLPLIQYLALETV